LQNLKAAQKEAAKAYSSVQATAGEAQKAAAPASAPVAAAAPKPAPAPVDKVEVVAEAPKAEAPKAGAPKAEAKKEDAALAPKAAEAPKPAAKPAPSVAAAKPATKPYTPKPIVVSEETLEDPNVDPKLIGYGFSKAPGNLRISNEQADNMPPPSKSKPIDFMAIAKNFKKSVDKVCAAPSPGWYTFLLV
jgi:hypothetical protein